MSEHDEREDYDDEPWRGRRAPESLVRWPATAIWALGLGQFALSAVLLGVAAYEFTIRAVGWNHRPGEWKDLFRREDYLTILAGGLAGALSNAVILRGAAGLRRFRQYAWAVAATLLTVLAIPFFLLAVIQLPLGLWVLYLLLRRDVRARFVPVARGTMNSAPPGPTDANAP